MSIFVTSDTYFGRNFATTELKRKFSSLDEMNKTLIDRWNQKVSEDDIVYHLGNFSWDPITAVKTIKRLNGKIKLLPGQWDYSAREIVKQFPDKIEIIEDNLIYLEDEGQSYILSSWPFIKWPGMLNQVALLHGSVPEKRTNNLEKSLAINVATDHWKFAPVKLQFITELIKEVNQSLYEQEKGED